MIPSWVPNASHGRTSCFPPFGVPPFSKSIILCYAPFSLFKYGCVLCTIVRQKYILWNFYLQRVAIRRFPQVSTETLDFGFLNIVETVKDQKDFQSWAGYVLHQDLARGLWGAEVICMYTALHRLRHFNPWSSFCGGIWKGCGTLLKYVGDWGQNAGFNLPTPPFV